MTEPWPHVSSPIVDVPFESKSRHARLRRFRAPIVGRYRVAFRLQEVRAESSAGAEVIALPGTRVREQGRVRWTVAHAQVASGPAAG